MSRDFHSYDPQDMRDTPPERPIRRHKAISPDARDRRSAGSEASTNREATELRKDHSLKPESLDSPRAYYLRDREYSLRESELYSLGEIGKFRVVAAADLAKHSYGGDPARMERDITHLKRQNLLADKTIEVSQQKTLRVLTLTKAGSRLLRKTNYLPEEQAVYHGLLKPREAKHDADLYRLYHTEAAKIERAGGRPVRVLLDYELKRNLNRDLALLEQQKDDPDAKQQVAEKHDLELVNGKIPLPDLRIEYETPELELRYTDVELATCDYRPRGLAEKANAGFSLYSRPEDSSRLRRILNDREITAEILSL